VTNRERALAVLEGAGFDRMPVAHWGFWPETVAKWAREGHLAPVAPERLFDGSQEDHEVGLALGFDFNWGASYPLRSGLFPAFERRVLRDFGDGSRHVLSDEGVVLLEKTALVSIQSEIAHTLLDRASWEEHYLPRLRFDESRIDKAALDAILPAARRENPMQLYCGSLYGVIRNWFGVEGLAYLTVDDPGLHDEIVDTLGDLVYRSVEAVLDLRSDFDGLGFWEDICAKNGPLVLPELFARTVGPWYRRITSLAAARGIPVRYVDCDGLIDTLLPIWLENGVETMFPIEVGTWEASIAPWRARYGPRLRGVGGMDKRVFAEDRAAVDAEIERLKPLVDLGGYLPCPDHRIPPDAEWDLVSYYCDRFRRSF
jgi:hypothetical protein